MKTISENRKVHARVRRFVAAAIVIVVGYGVGIDEAQAAAWQRVGTVTTLTPNQLCYTDGTHVVCDTTAPTNSGGLIGIGSTAPIVSLDLSQEHDAIALPIGTNGNRPSAGALASGEIRYNTATPAVEYYNGSNWISLQTSGGAGTVNSGTQYQMGYYPTTGSTISGDANITTDANNDFIIGSGNLAIGTTSLTSAITITGQAAQTIGMIRELTASTAGNNLTLQAGGAVSAGTNLSGGNLILASGVSTGTGSSTIQFNTYNGGSTGTTDNPSFTALTLSATGSTGVSPVTTLQATAGAGTNQNGGTLSLASGVSTGTGTSAINFKIYGAGSSGATANSATTAMTIASSGNVGIGTTSPAAKLDVYGGIDISGVNGISFPPDYTTDASIAIGSGALASQTAGTQTEGNIAIGYQALGSTSFTGFINTAVGYKTLSLDTTGQGNAAYGYVALPANTTGNNNTGIGAGTLYTNSTGSQNTALGYQALHQNSTASNNTAIGYNALYNSTGGNNTAIGYNVGSSTLTTGSSNILIGVGTAGIAGGADTPQSSTSNYLNIGNTLEGSTANANAVTAETLYLNSVASSVNYVKISGGATGTGPTIAAAGTDTNINLTLSPQGTGNTIIPIGSVGIGTTSPASKLDVYGAIDIKGVNGISFPPDYTTDASIAIGSGALAYQTLGTSGTGTQGNIAIGYNALGSSGLLTAATSNIAVGNGAMSSNTTGHNNTAIARSALGGNTTGNQNTAIGNSLQNNTTGNNNTAVGYLALSAMVSGGNSTAVGQSALGSATGQDNTAVGNSALGADTTGLNNTALGFDVGYNTLSTGSFNILIGVGTGGAAGGADTPLSSTSNFLNIGNTLEGSMVNANSVNGETLYLNSVSSSVNYLKISGGATGTGPTVAAAGTDTNINLTLSPKGTGNTLIPTGALAVGTSSVPTGITAGVNGVVQVAGTGSESCNANTIGAMRLNASNGYMEICTYP